MEVESEKKKRSSGILHQTEEERAQKQQKNDDGDDYPSDYEGDDWLFAEYDSDSGFDGDDLELDVRLVEESLSDDDDGPDAYDEWKEGRKCLVHPKCHVNQHCEEFDEKIVFELFKVRVIFNKKFGSARGGAKLHGAIATNPSFYGGDNHEPAITYLGVSHDDPIILDDPSLEKNYALLPIPGPVPRPPICHYNNMCLVFALKLDGDDIFTDPVETDFYKSSARFWNPRVFGEGVTPKAAGCIVDMFSPFSNPINGNRIARVLIGNPECDRILLAAYYSKYFGSWATIDVRVLDGDVRSIYGLIVARPCIFRSRIRLLTIQKGSTVKKKLMIQRGDEMGEIDADTRSIKLTRSIVAVPSHSSLIIGAKLYDERDDRLICAGRTFFPAQDSGEVTKIINYDRVAALEVRVQWNFESMDYGCVVIHGGTC